MHKLRTATPSFADASLEAIGSLFAKPLEKLVFTTAWHKKTGMICLNMVNAIRIFYKIITELFGGSCLIVLIRNVVVMC